MKFDRNLLYFAILILAVFLSGVFLQRSCDRTGNAKDELKEIKKDQKEIVKRIDSLMKATQESEKKLLKELTKAEESLLKLSTEVEASQGRIDQLKGKIQVSDAQRRKSLDALIKSKDLELK